MPGVKDVMRGGEVLAESQSKHGAEVCRSVGLIIFRGDRRRIVKFSGAFVHYNPRKKGINNRRAAASPEEG